MSDTGQTSEITPARLHLHHLYLGHSSKFNVVEVVCLFVLGFFWWFCLFARFGVSSRSRARPNALLLLAGQGFNTGQGPHGLCYHLALNCRERPVTRTNPHGGPEREHGTAGRLRQQPLSLNSCSPPCHTYRPGFNSFINTLHRRLKRISPPQYRQSDPWHFAFASTAMRLMPPLLWAAV